MGRRISGVVAGIALAASVGVFQPAGAAAGGGGCVLQGTANFKSPLTTTAHDFNYSFHGDLTNCNATETVPATGTVSAGEKITIANKQYQEPLSSGNGSCANGTTKGTGIIAWADGKFTVITYTTTSAGAAVLLQGTVIPSVTLTAVPPATGTKLVSSGRWAGGTAVAPLGFNADPTACAGAGVTNAGIAGAAVLATQS